MRCAKTPPPGVLPSPPVDPAASRSTAVISAPMFCTLNSSRAASASRTIRGSKNNITRVSCLNTPAAHTANTGASFPVASDARALHHA